MALARFQDLCLDVTDEGRQGAFWSSVLGLALREGRTDPAVLQGATPQQSLWLNTVPEPRTVKHRVHLDVDTESVAALEALGASVLVPATAQQRWTVMADPEGGEFCAFVRPPGRLRPYRLYEVVVDCAVPERVARWWGEVLGLPVGNDTEHDWWWLEAGPGAAFPFESLVFVPVPEPKRGKNRLHWDVQAPSVQALVDAGATVVGVQPHWTVLADPEGNEFCVFPVHE
jgi:catechol 2,3-dioxygenase-like lactoylglutathione lyase family enzyme